MKKLKICAILYFVSAICCGVTAVMNYLGNNLALGACWTSISSMTFLIAAMYFARYKKEKNMKDN